MGSRSPGTSSQAYIAIQGERNSELDADQSRLPRMTMVNLNLDAKVDAKTGDQRRNAPAKLHFKE